MFVLSRPWWRVTLHRGWGPQQSSIRLGGYSLLFGDKTCFSPILLVYSIISAADDQKHDSQK